MSDISEDSSAFGPFFAIFFFFSQGLWSRGNVFLIVCLCLFLNASHLDGGLIVFKVVKILNIIAEFKFEDGSVQQIFHLIFPDDAPLGWVVKDDAGVLFVLFLAASGLHPEDGGPGLKVNGLPACVVNERTAFAHDLDLELVILSVK